MHINSLHKFKVIFKVSLVTTTFLLLLTVCGCKNDENENKLNLAASTEDEDCLWQRISKNFKLEQHAQIENKLTAHYIEKYSKETHNLKQLSRKAEPYLYYIIEQLEQRDLPSELVFLPMIESAYHPHARSNKGAAGLWQIGAITGKRYGLASERFYDGRLDITESTKAALDYLQFLYKDLGEDWLLAIAAYNAGEGRVKQAIKKNKSVNKPTDFWSLQLPRQTQEFVPKILALSHIVKNVEKYNPKLATIKNEPYFVTIDTKPMGVIQAAKLAELDMQEFKKLNPGYYNFIDHPKGRHTLLLPTENASIFVANLEVMHNTKDVHTVAKGENLSSIANQYKTSIYAIKLANSLKSDTIKPGEKLTIPDKFKNKSIATAKT